ncbi:pre-mRNA-splicing factor CWC22 [Geosmithia morbida]|uniref:Pre-mRNA-splicing factor CWC22 n=1 Tax=Geosmithia morbida TaxID=1094350 RepID=A0A9P4YQD0_9HYPO|nr:pre-mRNA-splicing factor CWC22 [Geosmithia morbida]KAF4121193.1 pre-mRNA-splicing factor CWC22 [Geosmithia morbida]
MASAEVVDIPRRDARPRRDSGARDGGDSYRPPPSSGGARAPPPRRSPPPPPPARTEEEKQAAAKAEYEKLLTMRSGGTYIPPARLRALQSQITDKTSKEYQRMAWEALKKSINGLINKVNTANIKHIVPELFGENLMRGRGLFCRSIMKAQAASLPFTPIYAAMAAIVNTKLPQVGELLVRRLVLQFRKGFRRNDKAVCLSATTFIAHLINHQVQNEMLAGQMLLLLLNKPTDDSVEIAVGFCREVGQYLEEMQPTVCMAIFDQFRNILHEADIDKRTQYMVEVLFQVRKDKFKDNPAIKEELDLVEEEDQITHGVELDDSIDAEDGLNIFKYDEAYEENEEEYKRIKAEILGEASDDDDDDDGEDDDDDESSDEEEEEQKAMEIKDQSNADLVNLRRTIYLTIMSSADPEEAVHKLMKINLPAGQEPELPSMIVECCSQEKTYTKFFGLIGERFAKINRLWCDLFEQAFVKYYDTIHRYENNKLRNIAMLFGHMFGSDALGWHCMSVIHLNEDETTSSSRIFIKILFQQMTEELGMPKLKARMTDDVLRPQLEGLFPRDNPRNIRFSINYFTSIGMGTLTEEMREHLQNMPKPALPAALTAGGGGGDDSDSDSVSSFSSYTGSSYSSRSRSRSRTPPRRRARSYTASVSPAPRGRRSSRSPASYDSRSRSRSRSRSLSGSRSRSRSSFRSYTRSASPPPRKQPQPRGGKRSRSSSHSPRSSGTRSPPPPSRRSGRRDEPVSRSPSRSRSPRGRRSRSASYSSYSRSPSRSRSRSRSRSPTPATADEKRRRYDSRSVSRSPTPPRRGGRVSRDADASVPPGNKNKPSRSPSPSAPARTGGGRSRRGRTDSVDSRPKRRSPSPVPAKRRRYNDSLSRSPPPVKRGRRGD